MKTVVIRNDLLRLFLTFSIALVASVISASGQGGQIIRNQFTTNNAMNIPIEGYVSVWNDTAKRWSNAVVTASNTNFPAYVLTNGEMKDVIFNSSILFNGFTTNANVAYFQDDIVQGSGNTAGLGNLNVAGSLTAAGQVEIGGGALFNGPTTNANTARFQDDIFQTSGNAAQLGTLNVLDALTSPLSIFTDVTMEGDFLLPLIGPGKLLRTDSNTNLAEVQFSGGISFDGTTLSGSGGGGVTNKLHQWTVYSGAGSSTNTYYAQNTAIDYFTNSVDFAGLLQSIVNRDQNGFSIKVLPIPYYTNAYVFSNTVTITNWGTIYAESAGNPTVAFRAAPGLAGPLVQLGTTANRIGGISGWRDIRFEGDQGATNCVGVEIVNIVEPLFDFCEFTGFKLAGIHVNSTNSVFWSHVARTWFVQKWTSSHGILFSGTPIDSFANINHFNVWNCTFGMDGVGAGITVSNYFPGLLVQDNRFFGAQSGTGTHGIGAYAGGGFKFIGNTFDNFASMFPIYLYDRGGATNYQTKVSDNDMDTDGPVVVVGEFIEGVTVIDNGAANDDTVFYAGSNGNPTLLEKDRLLINNATIAQSLALPASTASRVAIIDASTNVTSSSSVDTTELGYLDGVTSAIQTQFAAKLSSSTNGNQFLGTPLSIISGVLLTNAQIRGVTPLGLTASRPAYIDASGNLTNASGTPDGTKFLRDDGVLAVPSGSGGSATNFSSITITNAETRIVWNAGSVTNLTIPWGATNRIIWSPASNAGITMSGTPGGGIGEQIIHLTMILTNSEITSVVFPTTHIDGEAPFFITAPSTNEFDFITNGASFYISSGQFPSTGSGPIVLQTNASIYSATLTIASSSTNLIDSLTEDTSPTTNDTVMVHDRDTATVKKVAITNLRGSSSGTSRAIIGYEVDVSTTVADATTYYLGKGNGTNLRTVFSDVSHIMPYDCTVTRVVLHVFCTLGTSENMTLNMTDGTNDSATWTVSITNARDSYDSGEISYAVTAGEEIALELLTPTWATNPTIVFISADVYVTF